MKKYFHHGWRFWLSSVYPMDAAIRESRDPAGRSFQDPNFDDSAWETVSLPHTFNDADLFATPIEDAGSAQKRTVAFYRNRLVIPPLYRAWRVILAFEGVRQACYVYVNGQLAGYYEMGVGPFGMDLTPYLSADGENCIAVAVDNTSTRNIAFCIAETPNKPDVMPGWSLQSQDEKVPAAREGTGFQWNCNDFNPTLGGLSHPVAVYLKPPVHLTLPLYANLRSRGTYVYATDFSQEAHAACIHVEAEVRNTSIRPVSCAVRVSVETMDGRRLGSFASQCCTVAPAAPDFLPEVTITPEDAYEWDAVEQKYVPAGEDQVAPMRMDTPGCSVIACSGRFSGLAFWEPAAPVLYRVHVTLVVDGQETDAEMMETGFREVAYDPMRGVILNGHPVWLRGYAQRAANEWAAAGIVPQWMHDRDMQWVRESGANHIRWMHVAACPEDLRAADRQGVVCTQPAGDKERETFGRQWNQRRELMRNIILSGRNHPSILFWEAGNNVISAAHMREMRLLKEALDPHGGRFMGCRTIHTEDALQESEYVGTMLNRHAARFLAEHGPITETEYAREEAPRRVWDDDSPPDYDYRNRYLGKGGRKQKGLDFYDLTSEEFALANIRGYSEFFHDRLGGASGKNLYSACAALCWTDSAQHGRQSYSENGRMSGRVDAIRVKKQSFDVFRVIQSVSPQVKILGHWDYPPEGEGRYLAREKRFNGLYFEETDTYVRRDPKHKTVYCVAGYGVSRVVLYRNGEKIGACDEPEDTFVFPFPDVDVTRSGWIEAVGFDYEGCEVCRDRIESTGQPARIRLRAHTAPGGWKADGTDIAYVDVAVTDAQGRVCPLCDARIDFQWEGPAVFLGGYNSGRFQGNGRDDSVIHKPFVYAECGTNRVLMRAETVCGQVRLSASSPGLEPDSLFLETAAADTGILTESVYDGIYPKPGSLPPRSEDWFARIPEADRQKYVPETEDYCKIMVNGQEPDFRGVRAVNHEGRVWGNVLCILERVRQMDPARLDYTWDAQSGILCMHSGGHEIVAAKGATHLLVDGRENLMDGQPYVTEEGILVMEANALLSWIQGAEVQYDDRIHALRMTLV